MSAPTCGTALILLDAALRKLLIVRDFCIVQAVEIRLPRDVITLVNRFESGRCDGFTVA